MSVKEPPWMRGKHARLVPVLLLLAGLACTACSDAWREHLGVLPIDELELLGDLVGVQGSAGAALVEDLASAARSAGSARDLLRQALDEIGHPLPQACAPSARETDGAGPFIYFFQAGAGGELRGVSMALLCFLQQGLRFGPAASADGGVATCLRFPRFCESWLHFHAGTRVEVWVSDTGEWLPGTVLWSTVHRIEGSMPQGELTIDIDDGTQLEARVPGHILRHLIADSHADAEELVRFWEWSSLDQDHFLSAALRGADFVLNPWRLGADMLPPGSLRKVEPLRAGAAAAEMPLVYVTVLRHPLDAIMARVFAARGAGRAGAAQAEAGMARWSAFLSGAAGLEGLPWEACPFELDGTRCWDSDYYTQSLVEPALCPGAQRGWNGGGAGGAGGAEGEACPQAAEEEALRRVQDMQVVLMPPHVPVRGRADAWGFGGVFRL